MRTIQITKQVPDDDCYICSFFADCSCCVYERPLSLSSKKIKPCQQCLDATVKESEVKDDNKNNN